MPMTGINCTNWSSNTSDLHWSKIINHPCYVWTFIESFWWSLMTITTVGYELSPKSFLGKLIGVCCALSGWVCLRLIFKDNSYNN